jgi:membrane protease YdiL (CAAX protease family)
MKRLGLILGVVAFLAAGLLLIKLELGVLRPYPLLEGIESRPVALLGGALAHLTVLGALLLLVWLASRLSGMSLADTGVFFDGGAPKHFFWGGAVTVVAGGLTCLAFIAIHRPSYAVLIGPGQAVVLVLLGALATVFQAGYEELWMRSWPLAALARVMGRHAALATIALAFAAVHLLNPQYSWLAVVNTGLAGLMMGFAFFKPADGPSGHPSIWLPWGLHWGWNFITGGVLYNRQVFEVTVHGERINQFNGAEATLAGCLLVGLAIVAVLRLPAPGCRPRADVVG